VPTEAENKAHSRHNFGPQNFYFGALRRSVKSAWYGLTWPKTAPKRLTVLEKIFVKKLLIKFHGCWISRKFIHFCTIRFHPSFFSRDREKKILIFPSVVPHLAKT